MKMDRGLFRYSIVVICTTFLLSGCLDQGGGDDEAPEAPSEPKEKKETTSSGGGGEEQEMSWSDYLKEKRALESEIKKIEKSQESSDEIKQEELAALKELEEVRTYLSNAQKLSESTASALGQWKAATRKSFEGVRLKEVQTIAGETYTDVTITGVADETVSITHSGGSAEVEISSLPLGLRKNLIHESTVLAEKGL
ncbi:MAG: hypothetical protein CMO55_04870 [Verrucomicrobiales bacterium]|nr:hypothetical protein [Verrucomicrobiales bacterium]